MIGPHVTLSERQMTNTHAKGPPTNDQDHSKYQGIKEKELEQ